MFTLLADIQITPTSIVLNGENIVTAANGMDLLNELYRRHVNDYPKFFKMDGLCKLGFVASELLLQSVNEERFVTREDRAVVLFNRSGSIEADRHYQSTISDADNYFPSPSVFVYTLPNIVTGEIAIRNKYHGETSFMMVDSDRWEDMQTFVEASLQDDATTSILTGWVDFYDENHFETNLKLLIKNK